MIKDNFKGLNDLCFSHKESHAAPYALFNQVASITFYQCLLLIMRGVEEWE